MIPFMKDGDSWWFGTVGCHVYRWRGKAIRVWELRAFGFEITFRTYRLSSGPKTRVRKFKLGRAV